MKLWMLITCLALPLVVAPVLAYASRFLFAIFIREAAELFVGMEVHRTWSMTLGTDVALVNAIIFTLAWWGTVGLCTIPLSSFIVMLPFLLAVVLALFITRGMVKGRLKLQPGDAWLVGLISFAGGNLPLIVIIPLLLTLVMSPNFDGVDAVAAE